jgi:hypothetical protein
MNDFVPTKTDQYSTLFKQRRLRICLCKALLLTFFPLSCFSQNTPALADSNNTKKPSINLNDQFRGKINLPGLKETAELSVIITNKVQNEGNAPEYQIEAVAVVKVNDRCSLYGLTGQYDENWKQLNLYDIADAGSLGAEYAPLPKDAIPGFEPIGFIGKFLGDPMLLQCQIAYGGIETLYRIEESRIASRGIQTMIKECQAGNTPGDLLSFR